MRAQSLQHCLPWLMTLLALHAAAQPSVEITVGKASPRPLFSRRDEPMVDIAKVCPGICIEMRYATERNLAGWQVYPTNARALIRKSVAARLRHAQDELHKQGYGLKIWDAYRPPWAQDVLWNALPESGFLAPPSRGGSYHSWGVSVDVTLVDLQGHEQKMASGFDELTLAAKSEYVGSDPGIAQRMQTLRTAMKNAGFNGIRDEWWHFTAEDGSLFAPVDMPLEEAGKNKSRETPRDIKNPPPTPSPKKL
ncbi:MAG TPA: M15 family metallopeptidase [Chthoniobacter sp.]